MTDKCKERGCDFVGEMFVLDTCNERDGFRHDRQCPKCFTIYKSTAAALFKLCNATRKATGAYPCETFKPEYGP